MKPGQIPFVRLFIPFATGIITAINFPAYFAVFYFLPLFLVLILAWIYYEKRAGSAYPFRWVYGILVAFFLFCTGYSLILLHTPSRNKSDISMYVNRANDSLLVTVISIPQEKDKSIKATVEVSGISRSGEWINTTGKVLLYFHKDSNSEKINYGDKPFVITKLKEIEPPSNPDEFDYRQFLHNKGICYEGYAMVHSNSITAKKTANALFQFTNDNRKKLAALLDERIGGDAAHVASAILLGYREDLSRSVVQTFVDSGTVHVICVAGLHVGIIFLLLNYIIIFPSNWKKGKLFSTLAILLLLWLYAVFTGLATPVLRATVMFSFLTIGNQFRKYTNSINTLAASAFLLLLFDPFSIADSGFQLSYLSVLGILLIYEPLVSVFEPNNIILRKIWELICVSASAQIAIFPLSLLYFHQFPNYFLFTNILVVPLLSVVIVSGILFFLTSWVPFVSAITAWALQKSILLMNFIVTGASRFPHSVSKGISISAPETMLLFTFLVLIYAFLSTKKFSHLVTGLTCLTVFFALRVYKDIIHRNQHLFVVYCIPNKPAYAFISGKSCVMAYSKVDSNDINYHIQYHWWNLGLKENKTIPSDTDGVFLSGSLMLQNRFVQFKNVRMAFISSDTDIPSDTNKINLQQVIVSGGYKHSMADLKKALNFDSVIFDSSVPANRLNKWKDECNSLKLAYYDVKKEGAFVEQL